MNKLSLDRTEALRQKPCPFCGFPPEIHFEKETYRDIYSCSNPDCFNTLNLTEEDWNTRK